MHSFSQILNRVRERKSERKEKRVLGEEELGEEEEGRDLMSKSEAQARIVLN